MSFTPPYTVRPERLLNGQHVAGRGPDVVDADGRVVCRLMPGEVALANLLAAAPEMLAALKAWVEAMTEIPAEPPLGGTSGRSTRLWVRDLAAYADAFSAAKAAISKAEEGGR